MDKFCIVSKKNNYRIVERIKDQKLLSSFYSLGDIFVICSLRENFPTSCIEAECCGVQVVGFDTGGTKETLINVEAPGVHLNKTEEVDTLVKYGDIDGLVEKMNEALNKNYNKKKLSTIAKQKFSIEIMADNYLKLYQDLMVSKG